MVSRSPRWPKGAEFPTSQSLAVRNWSRGTGTIVSVVWRGAKGSLHSSGLFESQVSRETSREVSGPWLQRQPDRFNESSDDAIRDQLPRRSHQPRGHRSHKKNARGNQHVVKSSRTVLPALPEGSARYGRRFGLTSLAIYRKKV